MTDARRLPDLDSCEEQLMAEVMQRLYPLHRSVAGPGLRDTLAIIAEYLPLNRVDVPTGSALFDWRVPKEWKIRDAWIADRDGRRVVDYRRCNLHVVSHSAPVPQQIMSIAELRTHLNTVPNLSQLIPYRSSPYNEGWGFCLAQETLDGMADDSYEVCIDSELSDGVLSYAELIVPGSSGREFLLSAHTCHPSLANDNLTGIAVAIAVARRTLAGGRPPRVGLRVVFAPGTIGALAWLANNEQRLSDVVGGLTLVCLGDDRPLTYKRTLSGQTATDQVAESVLAESCPGAATSDYHPWGYDERQYNSPEFSLPIGSLMRGRHGQFPEYHTSADTLDFVSVGQLAEAVAVVEQVFARFQETRVYRNLAGRGEPQLGRRGLFRQLGGPGDPEDAELAMLWLLALADGRRTVEQIAARAALSPDTVAEAADALLAAGLLGDAHAAGLPDSTPAPPSFDPPVVNS